MQKSAHNILNSVSQTGVSLFLKKQNMMMKTKILVTP